MNEDPASRLKAKNSGSLRPDQPINSAEDDQLARGRLVDAVGGHILVTDAPESVVIALNAPWGAGKSSFLNLLEQYITVGSPDSEPPIVIRFNPWNFGSIEQLIRMFFADLAQGIGASAKDKLGKKIGNLLNAAGTIAAAFSAGAGSLLKGAGTALASESSLPEIRAKLDILLPQLNRRVVVFIDDIDRLERDVLRLLFRMLRLNADFYNVTYVLAFDRLVVERSLDEESGTRGRDYLEKIIQVSFDLPAPEPETIQRIIFAELDAVLSGIKTRDLDRHRWGNIFHSGFKDHFRTVRHVKRYTNGLRLTLAPVGEEVNLADFLAIELIRCFHPDIYAALASNKHMLASKDGPSPIGVSKEQLHQWTEALCSTSDTAQQPVRQLLRQLFPLVDGAYSSTTFAEAHESSWRKNCRVCSADVFDKFFRLAVPSGDVPEVEVLRLIANLSDVAATTDALTEAVASGRARRLLERIEDFTEELGPESATSLIQVLFDLGDVLRFKSRGMLDVLADLQVPRLINQCAMRLPEDARFNILLERVTYGSALYTAVETTILARPNEKNWGRRLVSEQSRWEVLRDGALARILAASRDHQLWVAHDISRILFAWADWTTETDVRSAIELRVADDDNLLHLLHSFVTESHSYTLGDKVARTRRKLGTQSLERLLDLGSVVERLRGIANSGGDLATSASEFLDLIENAKDEKWDV